MHRLDGGGGQTYPGACAHRGVGLSGSDGTTRTANRVSEPWLPAQSGGMAVLQAWDDSDGGTWLASGGADGTIRLWDADTLEQREPALLGHVGAVLALTAWPAGAGTRVASAGEDSTIRVWDPSGPTLLRELPGHIGWVEGLAHWAGPDGSRRLASAGADGAVRVWDTESGRLLRTLTMANRAAVWALAAWEGPDGIRLAAGGDGGSVQVWDPCTGRTVGAPLPARHEVVWTLTPWRTAQGEVRLASSGTDGTIHIWDPQTGELTARLDGHTGWVAAVAVCAADDGILLASASSDGTTRVWDAESARTVGNPIRAHSESVPMLAAWRAPDGGTRLACGAEGGAIQVWDARTGERLGRTAAGHTAALWTLSSWPDPGGTRVAAGGDNASLRIWNSVSGTETSPVLQGHTAAVWALAHWTAPDGDRLASAGDDATVRIWDVETATPVGRPLTGHAGWIPALTAWTTEDGSRRLASGGVDATIRIWDADAGSEIAVLADNGAWVMSLATWSAPDGGRRLAAGLFDGTIRIWDPDTRAAAGPVLTGHDGCVRTLVAWSGPDGQPRLASGGFDGTVRIWDPVTGRALGRPLTGHGGRVASLAVWTDRHGGRRLASAGGDDGLIMRWDPETGTAVGPPLRGHGVGVWTLSAWTEPGEGPRLASSGYEGAVRLWDPEEGTALRTIEVGPVTTWGISDAPADQDLLNRQVLADAIADQVGRSDDGWQAGPAVVSVEGPWGCGKSTLMQLVRAKLRADHLQPPAATDLRPAQPLTIREALRLCSRGSSSVLPPAAGDAAPAARGGTVSGRGVLTAWFNPWVHQSGEQVWAGFAHVVIEAAAEALYPTEAARERYWFRRNVQRVDRFALRSALRRRMISPVFGLVLLATAAQVTITFAALNQPVHLFGKSVGAAATAVWITLAILLAGSAHTAVRFQWGQASRYLPAELFRRPVTEPLTLAGVTTGGVLQDPLRRAQAGALYVHQHDLGDILDDLADAGYGLVVFVDDIDRCQAHTTTEVFEAVNLFLSGLVSVRRTRVRFVLGLDPAVVADQLTVAQNGDQDTGWAFLRKLIHLPITVPHIGDAGIERFVDVATGAAMTREPPAAGLRTGLAMPDSHPATDPSPTPGTGSAPTGAGTGPVRSPAMPDQNSPEPVTVVAWRTMEQHPDVHAMFVERLAGQRYRSLREAKRLFNVWQLYERVLAATAPLSESAAAIARARCLVVLAEIITRWPALLRVLHQRYEGGSGFRVLADAADDDTQWRLGTQSLGLDATEARPALADLRYLLRTYDGVGVAELADRLL